MHTLISNRKCNPSYGHQTINTKPLIQILRDNTPPPKTPGQSNTPIFNIKDGFIRNQFQVLVSGSVWYDTDDELIANAVAHNYRTIGKKNVLVRPL
jgi:hypothetical protein